jgi:acetyl-CoA carboxylase biotin carboxyl carrier protein
MSTKETRSMKPQEPALYTLRYRDVVSILEMVRQSQNCAFFELEVGGWKVRVERGDGAQPGGIVPRSAPAAAAEAEGFLTVTAPTLGTFHHAGPAARIASGGVLGRIRTMGAVTDVAAPAGGEVVAILVEDGAFVEYGAPLVRLRRD